MQPTGTFFNGTEQRRRNGGDFFSTGCIPNDLGSYRATCCGAYNDLEEEEKGYRTGCGVGYECRRRARRSSSRSSKNHPDDTAETRLICQAASNAITDPLVQILPRYRLCRGVDHTIGIVHGLPVLDSDDTNGTAKLAYYSSHGDVTAITPRERIRTALIVVHGANQNADDYYCAATAAVDQQTDYMDRDSVLVMAPYFPVITADNDDLVLREGGEAIRWSHGDGNGAWRYGAHAVWPPSLMLRPNAFSSFDGMDKLVAVLCNRTQFPNLDRITIAGHSSGGQFVQRWSLLTSVWDTNNNKNGSRQMRAAVANPSSYAYLTPLRWVDNEWRIPTNTNCSDYNQWEWGLERDPQKEVDIDTVPSYVKAVIDQLGVVGLKSRFAKRSLVYLVGGLDICDGGSWCNSHGLETTCRDQLQGSNRRERHDRYMASLDLLNIPYHRLVVPGVGHDHSLMFNSANGLKALFGTLDDDGDDGVAFIVS